MATFYLINSPKVGSRQLYAGSLINDAQVDVAKIRTAGGVLISSSNGRVAEAAVLAQKMRRRGVPIGVLGELMEGALNSVHERLPKGADIAATGNVFWSDGARRVIAGLAANATLTLKTTAGTGTGARAPKAGERLEFSRTDTGAFTVAFVNDGPGGGTLATLAVSKVGGAVFEFNAAGDWELVNANPV